MYWKADFWGVYSKTGIHSSCAIGNVWLYVVDARPRRDSQRRKPNIIDGDTDAREEQDKEGKTMSITIHIQQRAQHLTSKSSSPRFVSGLFVHSSKAVQKNKNGDKDYQ